MLHSNIKTENILIARNTRPTCMRILVYNFLAKQHAALSITEIEKHFQHADRITIYRTLKHLRRKGLFTVSRKIILQNIHYVALLVQSNRTTINIFTSIVKLANRQPVKQI